MLFYSLIFLLIINIIKCENVRVKSALGMVEGFRHTNSDGSKSDIFLGIRYAKSPTGKLRFEKPMPYDDWDGVFEAKNFSKSCIPVHKEYMLPDEEYDEDCLFLNIIRPSGKPKDQSGFPVLVYIHGGGFISGSSAMYGYKSFSEHFASHGIMVVTFNYRLGPFGYFTTGDRILPGNYGFYDQMYALFFLNQFLSNFNGNVFQITVMGHSSGAASLHGLGISPYSVELFHRGIQLSGSLFSELSMNDNVIENSLKLSNVINCNSKKDSKYIHDCMKNKTVDEILDGIEELGVHNKHVRQFLFTPRKDGEFFPQTLDVMMKAAPDVPMIFGLTDNEYSKIVNQDYHSILNINGIKNKNEFDKAELQNYISEHIVPHSETGRSGGKLRTELFKKFVDKIDNGNSTFYLQKAVDIMSDISCIIPVIQQIEIRNSLNQKTYLFYQKYHHKNDKNTIHGASHGNELDYIFDLDLPRNYEFDENDKIFQTILVEMIRSFVKDGEPKTLGIKWPTTNKQLKHVMLNPQPSIEDKFLPEKIKFWLRDLPKNVGTKILQDTRLPHTELHQKHTEL